MVRIAVVNDDTDFLTLMAELLEDRGWTAIIHREGEDAYQLLKRELPDLIILDIRMGNPEQGWTILELLTLDPEIRSIPVIVCSAAIDDLRKKQDWLHEKGISILPKPFDIDDLYQSVALALDRRLSETT
jgi:CheY-like chemotaxis protein